MALKRMNLVVATTVFTLMASNAIGVQAQSGGGPPMEHPGMPRGPLIGSPITPGSAVNPAMSFDASLLRVEALWMGVARAMPADQYSFAPSAEIFASGQKVQYDGVRTFAQIVTHTIQAHYSAFAAIGGIKPDVDVKAIGDLKQKDDIIKALTASFSFAHKAVANVTAANAFQSVRGVQTPASMFAGAIGHAEDEYGQAVEYLRMNAIVPPASEARPKM